MPIEVLLAAWGVTAAFNAVLLPILQDLAKEAAKDFGKDFCKDALKSVLLGRDPWKKAVGRAMREFLEQFEQELIGAGVAEADVAVFLDSLQRFTKVVDVRGVLGSSVTDPNASLDVKLLADIWAGLKLWPLPADFDWQKLCRRYQNKARAILRDSDDLRPLLDSQNLDELAAATGRMAPMDPGFDLVGYAHAMRDRYSRLALESVDVTGSYYRELELWRVFIPQNARECQEYLLQVLELPKEHLRRLRERDQLEGEVLDHDAIQELRRRYVEQPIRGVLELADDPQFPLLVILGDPGSGKSSLLRGLLMRWADLAPADMPRFDLPLMIELRSYAQARQNDGVADFLDFFLRACDAPWRLDRHRLQQELSGGRARVYFDGLDEVFDPALRQEVVTSIIRFSNEYPRARIIVTSRVIGYKGEDFRHADFRHFMLQELDDDQIVRFLENWHRDTYRPNEAAERDEKHARLTRAIAGSRPIRELAGNPLLLTMMAILNRNRDLPRDRADLYERCAGLLLDQWKVEEAMRADPDLAGDALSIGPREKQALLRRLAREMQTRTDGSLGNLIAADRLEEVVKETLGGVVQSPLKAARALIRQLRERNFILCFAGGDSYAFVHRTFLEYFCADDLRQRLDHENSIDVAYLQREVYGRHWLDETWHEVLCLLASMIHPSKLAPLFERLLDQKDPEKTCEHIFLAARCVGEVKQRSALGPLEQKVRDRLAAVIRFDLDYSPVA